MSGPKMPSFGMDLTTDNLHSMKANFAQQRHAERNAGKAETDAIKIKEKEIAAQEKQKEREDREAVSALNQWTKQALPKKKEDAGPKPKSALDKEVKLRSAALAKYNAYHAHPVLKPHLPKKLPLSEHNSYVEINTALKGCRDALNRQSAISQMRMVVPKAVSVVLAYLESAGLLAQAGIEGSVAGIEDPLRAMMYSPAFQTEMAEIEVEYGDWFASPLLMRAGLKMLMFVREYANGQRAQATPLPADLAAKMAARAKGQ